MCPSKTLKSTGEKKKKHKKKNVKAKPNKREGKSRS
jgi:hypothetical protein